MLAARPGHGEDLAPMIFVTDLGLAFDREVLPRREISARDGRGHGIAPHSRRKPRRNPCPGRSPVGPPGAVEGAVPPLAPPGDRERGERGRNRVPRPCAMVTPEARRWRHPLAFHRGVLLDLGHVLKGLEDLVHDPSALVDVGQLAAPEEDVDQDLILVLQELAGPLDLDLDVVVAGLGPHADFLDLDLVGLLLAGAFLLLVLELAVVHDLADRRPFVGRDLDEVETKLAGGFHGLAGRQDAEHGAVGANDADGRNADLFVDPLDPGRHSAECDLAVRWRPPQDDCGMIASRDGGITHEKPDVEGVRPTPIESNARGHPRVRRSSRRQSPILGITPRPVKVWRSSEPTRRPATRATLAL